MDKLIVPKARKFGWKLKPVSSVHWGQVRNKTGQICVVLEHSLLRGVTCEMLHWWFRHFPNLKVRLEDVEGYYHTSVPAYLLWHPSDHVGARLIGDPHKNATSRAGLKIGIKEVMQYNKYDLKYPVDAALTIFYCEKDGWGMGKK
ncbi:MAG: hypothetical protein AAGB22_10665, partial [Bacteroidota bacterium]